MCSAISNRCQVGFGLERPNVTINAHCFLGDGRDLFEFPVSRTSDYAKVGKKGYLFEFDFETLLFTFSNDAGSFLVSNFICHGTF
jgi:hypothetical protein